MSGDNAAVQDELKQTDIFENEEVPEKDDEEDPSYGWLGYRPQWLQWLNRPVGFLVILSTFSLGQSMTNTGFIYVVLTTLEKRFNFSSVKSGVIASTYDITGLTILIFVTYFGGRGHKPSWIGIGALVYVLGCITFTIPHFATGLYEYGSENSEICNVNGTNPTDCGGTEDPENLVKYFGVFVFAQVLLGFGASPLYTLGQAFIDENVSPAMTAVYIGIFQAVAAFAPALGFVFGGLFLTVYTDLQVDKSEIDIDASSPVWVGAWWIGFLMTGAIVLTSALPLLGFPANLPGSSKIVRINEFQKGSSFSIRPGFGNSLKDFPLAAWKLIKNLPLMLLNLGVTMEWFILASVAVFGPKFMESQFNVSAGSAAILAGIVVVPSTLIGCLVGGWVIKAFDLRFKGQMKFCVAVLFISFLAGFIFLVSCPNVSFAGVNLNYKDGSSSLNITSTCNTACHCEDKFDPVCGEDNVMYYSPCHAGCDERVESDDQINYINCQCIPDFVNTDAPGVATLGRCDDKCDALTIYLVCIFVMFVFSFLVIVPSVTATLRIVDYDQRTFALGIQSLMTRALGSIPGPIIFGVLIDKTCLIWEYGCDDSKTCWMYDNAEFARYTFLLVLIARIISLACWSGAFLSHKPENDEENGGCEMLTQDKKTMENGGDVIAIGVLSLSEKGIQTKD